MLTLQNVHPSILREVEAQKNRPLVQASIPADVPAQPEQRERANRPIVAVTLPWYVVAWSWFGRQLLSPRRFTRWVTWFYRLPIRGAMILHAVAGGRVDESEFLARQRACERCPQRRLRISRKDASVQAYCARCGCPDWYGARLNVKNQLRRWRCPRDAHPREREAWENVYRELAGHWPGDEPAVSGRPETRIGQGGCGSRG